MQSKRTVHSPRLHLKDLAARTLVALTAALTVGVACSPYLRGAESSTPCENDSDCLVYQTCDAQTCNNPVSADAGFSDVNMQDAGRVESDWQRFGTEGGSSAALMTCSALNVRTDDLSNDYSDRIPAAPWSQYPVPDTLGRCGDDYETFAWRLLNCERLTRQLPPLDCDLRLVWIGRMHATDMRDRSYFAHQSPDGADAMDRLDATGVDVNLAGENLAQHPSVESAHSGWMESPVHRDNMLVEQYDYAGVGVVENDSALLFTEMLSR